MAAAKRLISLILPDVIRAVGKAIRIVQAGHHDPAAASCAARQSDAGSSAPSPGRVPIRKWRRECPGSLTIPALCPPEVRTKVISVSVNWWIL